MKTVFALLIERVAPELKIFVPVEGADHNDLIGVLGLYEYKRLLL